tara:strand:+ start:2735 stop:4642 length:1908 start_codon:yes stop_codon:yes gene_type:complete
MNEEIYEKFSLYTELKTKDKINFPKNYKNLYNILFFKKKKSNIFFFKSEAKYKVKIDFKMNLTKLKNLIIFNQEIPEKDKVIYFFKNFCVVKKYNNILDINEKIDLLIQKKNKEIREDKKKIIIYDNNIIKLGNDIILDLKNNEFTIDQNTNSYTNLIKGKIIFSELYLNNLYFLNHKVKKTLLLTTQNRIKIWKNEFIKKNINFIILNDDLLNKNNNYNKDNLYKNEKNILEKYDIVVSYCYNTDKQYIKNISWNNLVLDIETNFLKKNNFDYSIKHKNKYILVNRYYLLDNYTNLLNLYFCNYNTILLDTDYLYNFIEFYSKKNNKVISVKTRNLDFNEKEKNKYDDYINKFNNFYTKNNILFTDDIFLRKFCCYPQKNLKINILNYKNISNDIELFNIRGEYKKQIIKIVSSIKITLKNKKKNKCNICLNNINISNFGITTCGHYFCFSCIYKCINYKNECPTCRNKLSIDNIYYIKIGNNLCLDKKVMDFGILDNLGTKVKKLISLIKKLEKVVIFSNYLECLELLKNNFKQLDIDYYDSYENNTYKKDKSIFLLNYDMDKSYFENKFTDINDIIFLDPLYEKKENVMKLKYKYIFDLFENKNINVYNLIMNNSIEQDTFEKNYKCMKSFC